MIGEPTLPSATGLGLEAVDEIDDVVEAAACAAADAASGNSDGKMRLAGTGSADQDDVTLLGDEATSGEVFHEGLVDRRAPELKAVEILGQWQLCDRELVLDRARLLLADLGVEQIADDPLRLMLAFDSGGHDLVEGGLHAVELELAHEVEEFGAFHQMVLLRLS